MGPEDVSDRPPVTWKNRKCFTEVNRGAATDVECGTDRHPNETLPSRHAEESGNRLSTLSKVLQDVVPRPVDMDPFIGQVRRYQCVCSPGREGTGVVPRRLRDS